VILIHGVLSDHCTWRYLASFMPERNGLWLVDLPGCGESDAPSSSSVGVEFYAADSMADRLVLMAPFDVAICKPDPTFQEIVDITGLEVTLADLLGLLRGIIATTTAEAFDDPTGGPREEADRLIAIVRDMARRNASRAMLKQAVPWTDDLHPEWQRIEAITAEYANVSVPCLIL